MPNMNLKMGMVRMETPETKQADELCTITILFPVVTDEVAIAVKGKIRDVLTDIPDARIDFRIIPMGKRGA